MKYPLRSESLRRSALAGVALSALGAPLVFGASGALAQGQPSVQADDADVIVVTGSRIARAGFDTLQPAVEVDSDMLEARSFVSVADALNELPAFGSASAGTNVGGQSAQTPPKPYSILVNF